MTESNQLDCRIYVESNLTPDDLSALLAASLGDASLNGAVTRTIHTHQAEIDIRKNKEADQPRAAEFPDGFLYFRYAVEVYASPTSRHSDRVALVDRLLKILWSQGLPAVAACDYENELPSAGGYNNRSVPWPACADDSNKDIGSADQQAAPAGGGNAPSDGVQRAAGLEKMHGRVRK